MFKVLVSLLGLFVRTHPFVLRPAAHGGARRACALRAKKSETPNRKVALLVEPTPFTHVSGYANRFKEMLKHLENVGDEAAPAPAVDFRALTWQPGIAPALRARVEAAAAPLAKIARTAGFGRLTRSQLFVSDRRPGSHRFRGSFLEELPTPPPPGILLWRGDVDRRLVTRRAGLGGSARR